MPKRAIFLGILTGMAQFAPENKWVDSSYHYGKMAFPLETGDFKMEWIDNDGGRTKLAGFKGRAGDCVARAISIAAPLGYDVVYRQLKDRMGLGQTPRNGVPRKIYAPFIKELGGRWIPLHKIGQKDIFRVKNVAEFYHDKRVIVRCRKHVFAMIDGVVHDTWNQHEEKMVYGVWVFED